MNSPNIVNDDNLQKYLNLLLFALITITGVSAFSQDIGTPRFNLYFTIFFGGLIFFICINFKSSIQDLLRRYNPWNTEPYISKEDKIKDLLA